MTMIPTTLLLKKPTSTAHTKTSGTMILSASAREMIRIYAPSRSATLSRIASIPAPTMHHDPPPAYDSQPCNVIIFGETGTGKSSVVNLIAGKKLAETSSDAGVCTFASKPYHVVLENNRLFCVWDTIGLNEPEIPREDYLRAIKQAYKLIHELERSGGVHLLLLCMRGRLTKSVQQNYRLFVKVLCEKKAPLGVVITNLENERCMEECWSVNEEVFKKYDMCTHGHACVTASPGIEDIFCERYEESRKRVRELVLELAMSTGKGWKREVQGWLVNLLGKLAKMLSLHGRSSQGPTHRELMEKLVNDCGFSRKVANSVAASIIKVRDQTPGDDAGSL